VSKPWFGMESEFWHPSPITGGSPMNGPLPRPPRVQLSGGSRVWRPRELPRARGTPSRARPPRQHSRGFFALIQASSQRRGGVASEDRHAGPRLTYIDSEDAGWSRAAQDQAEGESSPGVRPERTGHARGSATVPPRLEATMAVFGVIVILAIAGVIIGGVVGAVIGATTTPFQLDPDAWVSGRGAQAYLGGVVGAALGACALAALWLLIDEERARRVRERRSPGK